MADHTWILVTLRNWLEHQLSEPGPLHDALEHAIAANDPASVRRIFQDVPFTDGQRRYFNDLIQRWQDTINASETASDETNGPPS